MWRWALKKNLYYLFSIRFRDLYEIVNLIVDSLSEQELKILETNYKGKILDFRDQLLMEHFYKYPLSWELKDIKSKIEAMIENHRPLLKMHDASRVREFFTRKLWKEMFLSSGLYDLKSSFSYSTGRYYEKQSSPFTTKTYIKDELLSSLSSWFLPTVTYKKTYRKLWLNIGTKRNWECIMWHLISTKNKYSKLVLTSFMEEFCFTFGYWETIEKFGDAKRIEIPKKGLSKFFRKKEIVLENLYLKGKISELEMYSLLNDTIDFINSEDLSLRLKSRWPLFWIVSISYLTLPVTFILLAIIKLYLKNL